MRLKAIPIPGTIPLANIAWGAGYFEGEGCIVRPRGKGWIQLKLASTDEDVVRRFVTTFGGHVAGPYRKPNPKWKPFWVWTTGNFASVQALLAMWWGWLGARRRAKASEVLTAARATRVRERDRDRCPKGHEYAYATKPQPGRYAQRVCSKCKNEWHQRSRLDPAVRAREYEFKKARRARLGRKLAG